MGVYRRLSRAARWDRNMQDRALPLSGIAVAWAGALVSLGGPEPWDPFALFFVHLMCSIAAASLSFSFKEEVSATIRLSAPVLVAANAAATANLGHRYGLAAVAAGTAACLLYLTHLAVRKIWLKEDDAFTCAVLRKATSEADSGSMKVSEYAHLHAKHCGHVNYAPRHTDITRLLLDPKRFLEKYGKMMEAADAALGMPAHSAARNMHQEDLELRGRLFECPVDMLEEADVDIADLAAMLHTAPYGTVETLWRAVREGGGTIRKETEDMNMRLPSEHWRETLGRLAPGWQGDGTELVRTVDIISGHTGGTRDGKKQHSKEPAASHQ